MDHCVRFIFVLVLLQSTFCFREAAVFVPVSEGQDCELPCSGHKEVRVSVLEWTRFDQRRDLLVFRAGRVQDGYEDPDFTNRVQLLDPQLQSGDLSVMLKNATFKDTGTYECQCLYADNQEISQFIHLIVTEPDTTTHTMGTKPTEGLGTGGVITIVIVVIGLIGLCLSIVFILHLKRFKLSQVPSREPDLEKSLPPSSGSNTSSSTTSSNLSNGSMKPLIKDFSSPSPRET